MNSDDLRNRTKQFALRIIKLAGSLPATRVGDVLGRQLLKSGTSIGANYRCCPNPASSNRPASLR
jgi:four helix bundle protein